MPDGNILKHTGKGWPIVCVVLGAKNGLDAYVRYSEGNPKFGFLVADIVFFILGVSIGLFLLLRRSRDTR